MKKLYHYTPMMIMSVFVVFLLILFEILVFINTVMFDPKIYSTSMARENVAAAIYEDTQEYFEQFAAPTGIPAEVFTKSLKKSELYQASYKLLEDSLLYLTNPDAPFPVLEYDMEPFEKNVVGYIEEDAEAHNMEMTEEYYKLIDSTINEAEDQIEFRLDSMMLYQLCGKPAGEAMHKYSHYAETAMYLVGALMVIFLLIMVFIDRHHPRDHSYWIGLVLAVSATPLLGIAAYLKATHFFDGFFLRTRHVYLTVTGVANIALNKIILFESIMLCIGLFLIILTLVVHGIYKSMLKKKNGRR